MSRDSEIVYSPGQEFAALHAPVAPYTWEVQTTLAGSVERTARVPIQFRGALEILGVSPSVVVDGVATGAPLRVPTADDIMVIVDINQRERLTNRLESTTVAGPGESFVTLSKLDVFLPRLFRAQLKNASPDMGLQFRWKVFNTGGAPLIYENARISLAFFCRYLDTPSI
jgi:hypothetical protein